MATIAETSRVHPNVKLGENVVIEDFCIIGYPPKGYDSGELELVIGDNTIIRSHSVIYAGSSIGQGCHIGHSVFIREHVEVGNGSSIGVNCIIEHHCTLGENVRMQGQAGLCEYTTVEDEAWIGPRVVTTNVMHPTCDRAKECLNGPTIGKRVILGANVCLAPGIEVGADAFVSASSMVTKSVEDGAILFGNPAKKVSQVEKVKCGFDMVSESPYPRNKEKLEQPQPQVPLMDLGAQYQALKQELRMATDRVVLNSRFINGKEVGEFEQAFAEYCGVKHAIGVGNGTDAIVLALKALNIGAGDEVITASHTFIATAEAIVAVGARPVFVDVDEVRFTLDPEKVAAAITENTKAIIPVHIYGQPADMSALMKIARENNLKVVEDGAQAHGAKDDGTTVGQWGDAACFSFYPGKNLGAYGDAGAVVTNDDALAARIRMLKDHGRDKKYTHDLIGVNSRLDTLHAAVLNVKLKRLNKWNKARNNAAAYYRENLQNIDVRCPVAAEGVEHVYHLFVIRTADRDALQQYMKERGVATGVHYPLPLHLQPALAELSYKRGDFPLTETLAEEILSLPMFPEITTQQQDRVIAAISDFFKDKGA